MGYIDKEPANVRQYYPAEQLPAGRVGRTVRKSKRFLRQHRKPVFAGLSVFIAVLFILSITIPESVGSPVPWAPGAYSGGTSDIPGDFGDLNDVSITAGATGDIYYRDASGNVVNLAIGAAGKVLEVSASGIPEWDTDDTGAGGSFDSTKVNDTTWGNGTAGTIDWTWDAGAGTDTVIQFGDNTVNVSTGALQVGGVAVQTGTIDISDDTNLAVTAPIVLTDDTLSISDATTAAKGAAQFSSSFFSVVAGLVSLIADCINDTHIDWGTGANQVSASDMPNEDIGDITITGGDWAVEDDSHNHVIGNIDSFTKADLETQCSDVADFAEADGDTYTGAHDFGGADSVEIPNGANPTTDAAGEVAIDTDDSFLEFYDGTASRVIGSVYTKDALIHNPDGLQATSDAIPLFRVETEWAPHGITITRLRIATNAASTYSVNFEEWTSPTDGSPSTIETVATSESTEAVDDSSIDDASIAVGSYVFIDLPDTDVNWLHVYVAFRINEGD